MPQPLQLRRDAGRRPRLSDAETERRMLDAGRRFVGEHGLSLSLEHLNMEELIAEAGVSRTSSYRRWPNKDAFAADLLLEIAEGTQITLEFAPYAEVTRAIPREVLTNLADAQGRRDAIVEVFRAITVADFRATLESRVWRSYLMLKAAHSGLPEGELRDRVSAALATTERGFMHARASMFRLSAELMGYRLRDAASMDWTTIAQLVEAGYMGLAVQAITDTASVVAERQAAPFGSSRTAGWNLAALSSGLAFFSATEPDPEVVWDEARVAFAQAALTNIDATLEQLWSGA